MSVLEQVKEPLLALLGLALIAAAVIVAGLIADSLKCDDLTACQYAIELLINEKLLSIKE